MVLGEGGVQLRLHGGGVLLGLHELVLQRLGPKHCVAEASKHAGLLAGSLCDVLHRQHMSDGYSMLKD
jgi:hypothetical protein